MIYPPSQKPPIWSIDPGVIAYNCQRAGMPHPVGAWPMWEGGGSLVRDYSGRGNHGTLTGGTAWVPKGIDFNGSDGYVDCLLPSVFDDIPNNDFSFSLRFNSHYLGTLQSWVRFFEARKDNNNYAQLHNTGASGKIGFTVGDAGTRRVSRANFALSANTLYDFVGTWNAIADTVSIYINGNFVGEAAAGQEGWEGSQEKLMIGARTDSSVNTFYDGIMYNFNIFNITLSAAQAKFLSDNPYFMYQIPEELYGYTAAAPPTGNPFWYYNMLKRRN